MASNESNLYHGRVVVDLPELAKFFKVHPSTIYRLLKKRRLPGFKVGRDWRFNLESIDKWRHEQEHNGSASR